MTINIRDIEIQLVEVIDRCRELGVPVVQFDDMVETTNAGEPGIASENLCTQLFEYNCVVPSQVLQRIETLGRAMGLAEKYWNSLKGGA